MDTLRYVVINAPGWTREFGLVRRWGATPEGNLEDAARVLDADRSPEERLVEWEMGRGRPGDVVRLREADREAIITIARSGSP